MEYLTRPYEVNPGQTDKVMKESADYLFEVFQKRPLRTISMEMLAWHFLSGYFADALRVVRKKFDAIEVDRLQVKPKIKITGEFWLQTHEGDGNYNIKRWLEQEGSEVMPPPVAVWLGYLLHTPIWRLEKKGRRGPQGSHENCDGARDGKAVCGDLQPVPEGARQRAARIAGPGRTEELASPFFHYELRGGEGHMLVGKALHAHLHKSANMTCELSPYSCMPNTMSQGAMANVLGRYPDLLYAPIEIKGDAEVHALSRCQMILTEAKKRAQSEFVEAMAKTGMTLEKSGRSRKSVPR
jgi:predicted nucleotide-binding protein (sugar kinase/HSP70/actin superfamily)